MFVFYLFSDRGCCACNICIFFIKGDIRLNDVATAFGYALMKMFDSGFCTLMIDLTINR